MDENLTLPSDHKRHKVHGDTSLPWHWGAILAGISWPCMLWSSLPVALYRVQKEPQGTGKVWLEIEVAMAFFQRAGGTVGERGGKAPVVNSKRTRSPYTCRDALPHISSAVPCIFMWTFSSLFYLPMLPWSSTFKTLYSQNQTLTNIWGILRRHCFIE